MTLYVTRDYNGSLRLHTVKPKKQGYVWHTDTLFGSPQSITLQENVFPDLKWTDNPIEVSLKKGK